MREWLSGRVGPVPAVVAVAIAGVLVVVGALGVAAVAGAFGGGGNDSPHVIGSVASRTRTPSPTPSPTATASSLRTITPTPTPAGSPTPTPTPHPTNQPVFPTNSTPTPSPSARPSPTPRDVVETSCIKGHFAGWSGETLFELCNGDLWVQAAAGEVTADSEQPQAEIDVVQGADYLYVPGIDRQVRVTQVTDFMKETIAGDFDGWDGTTQVSTLQGHTFEQKDGTVVDAHLHEPDIVVYRVGNHYRMKVYGIDEAVVVVQTSVTATPPG